MKKFVLLPILILFFLTGNSQTRADSLVGKWKYMGAMKTQSIMKTDASWYKNAKATPKFEIIEFNVKGKGSYNEKTKKPIGFSYTVSHDTLLFGGIAYKIKSVDAKDLTLYRGYYIVTDPDGRTTKVDDEQISFQKQK